MLVSELIKKINLKANKYTYFNLSREQISYFKKQYNYLKSQKNKSVTDFCIQVFFNYGFKTSYNVSISNYLLKLEMINFINTQIKH